MVGVSASVNLPLHHEVQKFSSGSGSPVGSQKKGRKTVVVWFGELSVASFVGSYQINARTELAIRYNDISPLENHHCAVAFQILSNPETNIFANVDQAIFKRIRSVRNINAELLITITAVSASLRLYSCII